MFRKLTVGTAILFAVLALAASGVAQTTTCSDQVPTLTGDTPAVSTSGIYSSSYKGWEAFDSAITSSSMWISETWETPAWIAYNFGSGKVIDRYQITNSNGTLTSRAPKDFTFQGWNGSSWVTLDTRTNQTGWVSGLARIYNVASPGSYTQYRLHITDDNDSRSGVVVISIGDLRFESCSCNSTTDLIPTLTGDSPAVSTSGIFSSSYKGWEAFDAAVTSSSMWISETWETPAWIAYNFGTSTVVDRYQITNSNGTLTSRAPKDFTFQGWNGSSWVTLDTRTNQTGWVSGTPRIYDVATPGSYNQYRLHITDDNDIRSGVVVISIGDLQFFGCGGPTPALAGSISGPTSGTTGIFYNWTANASGGTSPYTYSWTVNGVSVGSGSSLWRIFSQTGFYNIKVTISDSASNSVTVTRFFNVTSGCLNLRECDGPVPF